MPKSFNLDTHEWPSWAFTFFAVIYSHFRQLAIGIQPSLCFFTLRLADCDITLYNIFFMSSLSRLILRSTQVRSMTELGKNFLLHSSEEVSAMILSWQVIRRCTIRDPYESSIKKNGETPADPSRCSSPRGLSALLIRSAAARRTNSDSLEWEMVSLPILLRGSFARRCQCCIIIPCCQRCFLPAN